MGERCCSQCGEIHEELEPAFHRPDAVFAIPKEEREARVRQSDDFVSIDDQAFFIRGVVPIPVHGREFPYCWGFWVKVARAHFDEYRRLFSVDPPLDHPGFQGTLANQTRFLPPTLGLPVHVHLGRGKDRPRLMLLDDAHPLTLQQSQGLTQPGVHEWSSRIQPRDHPLEARTDPPAPLFTPTLEDDGWFIAEPHQVGKAREPVAGLPHPGDLVKAPFVFLAADHHGDVVQRVELMWVLLDEVRADGWWSGTLNNFPFVPGPIDGGSRVWLRAEHILGVQRAEPQNSERPADAAVARDARPRLSERLARWWRAAVRRDPEP